MRAIRTFMVFRGFFNPRRFLCPAQGKGSIKYIKTPVVSTKHSLSFRIIESFRKVPLDGLKSLLDVIINKKPFYDVFTSSTSLFKIQPGLTRCGFFPHSGNKDPVTESIGSLLIGLVRP